MMPKVVLLGRPNVGKSTLFNRLIRSNRAITHDRPGVTRDRMEGVVRSRFGRDFALVDTGGITLDHHQAVAEGPAGIRGFEADILRQAEAALKEADVICLNWINQGMLSLRGIECIAAMGKPIVWTMHDMWNATGICHHAGACDGFKQECGNCHLLGKCSAAGDLSHKVWRKKNALYKKLPLHFVAVSRWLEGRCRCSSLMRDADISVIPNAFPFDDFDERPSVEPGEKLRIVMGAARLDDPIKGFPILIEATRQLRERDSELADRLELVTFGSIRNEELFKQLAISHVHHGMINDMQKIKEIYRSCHIVISTSLFETLPGTLIEGLAHGCLAVAFDRGGQRDIIENYHTGYLATIDDDTRQAARSIVKGIIWAVKHIDGAKYGVVTASHGECGHVPPYNISSDTYRSMLEKFSAPSVAKNYISLFEKLLSQTQRTLNK